MCICWLNIIEVYRIVVILRCGGGWLMDIYKFIYVCICMYIVYIYAYTHTRVCCTRWLCSFKGKSKGKVHFITSHERPELEYGYSSTLSVNSALDGVGC
jgi:hypothetical protein